MAASRGREMEFDPGIEAIAPPYTMAAMAYFGEQLGMSTEHALRGALARRPQGLELEPRRGQGQQLRDAPAPTWRGRCAATPHLKVFVASGHYDLGTPYSASDWSLAQLDAPADVLARVSHHYYDAGHMMYTREADLTQLKSDLAAWLDG